MELHHMFLDLTFFVFNFIFLRFVYVAIDGLISSYRPAMLCFIYSTFLSPLLRRYNFYCSSLMLTDISAVSNLLLSYSVNFSF